MAGKKKTSVSLSDGTKEWLVKYGEGNVSLGIEKLVAVAKVKEEDRLSMVVGGSRIEVPKPHAEITLPSEKYGGRLGDTKKG